MKKDWSANPSRLILPLVLLISFLTAPAFGAVEADTDRGAQLYIGSLAMANGGSPCIACHALTGLGSAGAANYGPDLSRFYTDFSAEGVMAVLESLAFPSMESIYTRRPLTTEERQDLTAFFAQAAERKAPAASSLTGVILLGVVIVFVIVALMGLRRHKGARRPLVEQVKKQRGGMQ